MQRHFWLLFASLFLFNVHILNAADHFIYFGGGGDSLTSPSTVADQSGLNFTKLKKNGWNVDFHFGGEHPIPKEKIDEALGQTSPYFTKENFDKKIRSLIQKMKSGQFTPQDQVVIALDTHGSSSNHKSNQSSHTVWAIDYEQIDLDILKELTQLADQKGIPLAILDLSCYGGASQALASKNTCVVSMANPRQLAWTYEAEIFAAHLSTERTERVSLEKLFLETRSWSLFSQPEISSAAHQYAAQVVYDLERSLQSFSEIQKFTNMTTSKRNFCTREYVPNAAVPEIANQLSRLTSWSFLEIDLKTTSEPWAKKLSQNLEEYQRLRSSLERWIVGVGQEIVCTTESKPNCFKAMDVDSTLAAYKDALERAKKKSDKEGIKNAEIRIKAIEQLQRSPSSAVAYARWKQHVDDKPLVKKLDRIRNEIIQDERKLYQYAYDEFLKKNGPSQDACSRIKF